MDDSINESRVTPIERTQTKDLTNAGWFYYHVFENHGYDPDWFDAWIRQQRKNNVVRVEFRQEES